jgi:hypothetical protein
VLIFFVAVIKWYHRIMTTATAQAFANAAFIKYWGNFVISRPFKAKF